MGRARGDDDGVVLRLQRLDLGLAQGGRAAYVQAGFFKLFDVLAHRVAIQPELRYRAHQHAAGLVVGLENRHVIAQGGEEVARGQARRARADDGHALVVQPRVLRAGVFDIFIQVALDAPDGHGLVHQHAALADLLAGMVADVGTDGRQGVLFPDDPEGFFVLAAAGQADVALGADAQGAGRGAGLLGAEGVDVRQAHHRLVGTLGTHAADPALGLLDGLNGTALPAGAAVDAL